MLALIQLEIFSCFCLRGVSDLLIGTSKNTISPCVEATKTIVLLVNWGLLKKGFVGWIEILRTSGAWSAQMLSYAAASEPAISSFQMFTRLIQRERAHCREQNHARIATKKRRRSLQIFSAHITKNAIEIVLSAPLGRRAIIRSREYFLFPDPKHPSTSFRLR